MKKANAIFGIGPSLTILTIIYFLAAGIIDYLYQPLFKAQSIDEALFYVIGWPLLLVGVVYWFVSIRAIIRIFKTGKLCTTGVFGVCRHPLYASFVVFIVPGISLLFHSYLLLTVPVFMYLVFRFEIRREERELTAVFGKAYDNYKKRTNAIFIKLK
ncbi:MAG: isoprenylcysteine carboxylmethyltransferase family protein [Bacillota bacterium]